MICVFSGQFNLESGFGQIWQKNLKCHGKYCNEKKELQLSTFSEDSFNPNSVLPEAIVSSKNLIEFSA